MINGISSLATSFGLGLGSGINAYATLLVYGIAARVFPGVVHGELAEFFARTAVLVVIGVLYIVEFVADKFPVVDHAWDAAHTFIRPLAGAVVAFAAASPSVPRGVAILAALIGGTAALGMHAGKASLRATSTATTMGIANPILSVIEDIVAFVQAALAIVAPLLMLALVVIIGAVAVVLVLRSRGSTARG